MPALKANNPVSIAVGLVMPDRRCPSEAYTDPASHTMLSKTNPEGKGYRTKRAYLYGLHILYRVTNERLCCSGAARCILWIGKGCYSAKPCITDVKVPAAGKMCIRYRAPTVYRCCAMEFNAAQDGYTCYQMLMLYRVRETRPV